MKTLKKFVDDLNIVNEWFTSMSHTPDEVAANMSTEGDIEYVWLGYGRNVIPADEMEDLKGKDEWHNGSHGRFEMYPKKTDDEAVRALPKEQQTANQSYIIRQINHKQDFYVEGKRGWGKSSIIRKAATNRGRNVIVVYLNGADEQDLAGIPIPSKYKGETTQNVCIPAWAAYIINHPDEEFLLFFDELNQATPAVINKLMPMTEKYSRSLCGVPCKNFIVGAAGNYTEENRGLQDMTDYEPLIYGRLNGRRDWEETEDEWKAAYSNWMSDKEFVKEVGKELIDKLYDNKEIFGNPRSLEYIMTNTLEDIKAVKEHPEDAWVYTPQEIRKDILQMAEHERDAGGKINKSRYKAREAEEKATQLAQYLSDYIQKLGAESQKSEETKKNKKTRQAVDSKTASYIRDAIEIGYDTPYVHDPTIGEEYKNVRYVVAEDNAGDMLMYLYGQWDPDVPEENAYPRESIEGEIRGCLASGAKFKYKTAKQGEKDLKSKGEKKVIAEVPEY